jgi:hypothetical protein
MGLTEEQAAMVPQAIEATAPELSAAYLTSPNGGYLGDGLKSTMEVP